MAPDSSTGVDLFVTCCQVVDIQTGESLGHGTAGELYVKSPAMMIGYANNPQATAATIDLDGWLHTGNIMFETRKAD